MSGTCEPLQEGQILNNHHNEYPLYHAILYGDKVLTKKLSKRLSCAIKALPIRVHFSSEHKTQKALDAGISKDPSLTLEGKVFIEGLLQTEEITQIFQQLLKNKG